MMERSFGSIDKGRRSSDPPPSLSLSQRFLFGELSFVPFHVSKKYLFYHLKKKDIVRLKVILVLEKKCRVE